MIKFKRSEQGYKYFIGYQENEIVKPLCIILPQTSGYIKYFRNGGKNASFFLKDDEVLDKYNEIWDVIKNKLKIKFHSLPIYDKKYLNTKVREYDGKIKTNFLGNGKGMITRLIVGLIKKISCKNALLLS